MVTTPGWVKRSGVVLAIVAISFAGFGPVLAAPKPDIDICHTGNGINFVKNSPSTTADAGGHDGHEDDIIPPFDYDGGHYAGKRARYLQ